MTFAASVLIRITCPCNEHPLTPHFYIEKVGFTRVYIFFLFLLQGIHIFLIFAPKHRLWVLVRTGSNVGGSNVLPQSMHTFTSLQVYGEMLVSHLPVLLSITDKICT